MKTYLGLEFGSTRIKAVIIDENAKVMAKGAYDWENDYVNGLFTYPEDKIISGMQAAYAALAQQYEAQTGNPLTRVDAMGFSGMMHGYLALDKNGELLVPFRTWRNTNAARSADILTKTFGFNIPMRWSIAHLYQCVLDNEEHLAKLSLLTTLSGYIHLKLTGERVIGAGEASGMFPIDSKKMAFDAAKVEQFNALIADKGYPWKILDIMPKVIPAGKCAGRLTKEGALLLDPTGKLESGIPFCSPEGDASTGMIATNSVKVKTGNVSAGTSAFAMIVLENMPRTLHTEIDMVTTPDGAPVAMVHSNTCTSDINAWAGLFAEFAALVGADVSDGKLYELLFKKSLEGDADCGGLMNYNFLAGEPVVGLNEGKPLFVRRNDAKMNLANFWKTQIYASLATIAVGMEILRDENVEIAEMCGHGGFFKTPEVGQRAMSAAMGCPITVLDNAGEGGAWGMAVLAAYLGKCTLEAVSLGDYLDGIFANEGKTTVSATDEDKRDFAAYVAEFKKFLPAEAAAANV